MASILGRNAVIITGNLWCSRFRLVGDGLAIMRGWLGLLVDLIENATEVPKIGPIMRSATRAEVI